MELPMLQFVPI